MFAITCSQHTQTVKIILESRFTIWRIGSLIIYTTLRVVVLKALGERAYMKLVII